MKPEIIDNFLPDDVFKNIQNIMMSSQFPWHYNSAVLDPYTINDNDFYFDSLI